MPPVSPSQNTPDDSDSTVLHLRIPRALYVELHVAAGAESNPVSAVARRLIATGLRAHPAGLHVETR